MAKTGSEKASSSMWRMVCSVDNCQVTPRLFGAGQGAMTLSHRARVRAQTLQGAQPKAV